MALTPLVGDMEGISTRNDAWKQEDVTAKRKKNTFYSMDKDEARLRRAISDRAKDRRQLRWRRSDAIPNTLASMLKNYFKDDPQSMKQLEDSRLILSWPRIVGEAIAKVTEALRIRDNRLFISVQDPLWRQELLFQKHVLLKRIRAEFPKSNVRDIFFGG
ncbi:MAG: DUF721 domain-containing protein [Deltaproteobacteria bacterium]|nr:DUF721 domain-containing protein [Deltaproteobacteria bacterium]MBI3294301.1 DUF721 domain-containing protein [Deltaproteobacteria bacterium]